MASILDKVSTGIEAHIIQRVSGKEEAVILSYKSYLELRAKHQKLIVKFNKTQLALADSQFNVGDFETFTMNEDGSRHYL